MVINSACFCYFCAGPNPKHYNYVVRFINPQRKSDYKVRKWHDMNERFTSPEGLKEKLVDTFSEHVPETMEFDMGYYTKPGSQKRWIENSKDLEAMYNSNCNDDITLWCDGRIESGSAQVPKRKSSGDTKDEPLSKRAKKEEEIETTYRSLRAKHGEEFSDPQLRLWARMQVNGLHADLENPPNVPAITGQPVKRKRDEKSHPLTEAIAGAATAITKVLVSSQRPSTPPSISMSKSTGISPASKANSSGQYLEQLRTLQQLRENGALTEEEFCAQKQLLLHNLSGLNT